MQAEAASGSVRVEVVYALPGRAWSARIDLPAGATAAQALEQSGFEASIPGIDVAALAFAVFGRPVNATTVLRDGDRLELLRPLLADPKQARRRRARAGS